MKVQQHFSPSARAPRGNASHVRTSHRDRPLSRASGAPRAAYMAQTPAPSSRKSAQPAQKEPLQRGIVIDFSSASGGTGVSTSAACFARMAQENGLSCALLDMDFSGGGLDVTLGLEDAIGLRWSQIKAPLGTIDGGALIREAVDWDGIPLIPADPWNCTVPPWWEMAAVIDAFTRTCDLVITDSGPLGLATCLTLGGMGTSDISDGSDGTHELEPYTSPQLSAVVGHSSMTSAGPPPPPPINSRDGAYSAASWISDPRLSDTQLSGTRSYRNGEPQFYDPFSATPPAAPRGIVAQRTPYAFYPQSSHSQNDARQTVSVGFQRPSPPANGLARQNISQRTAWPDPQSAQHARSHAAGDDESDVIAFMSVHLVELSVLGLVRARMHRENDMAARAVCAGQGHHPLARGCAVSIDVADDGMDRTDMTNSPVFLGVEPSGSRRHFVLDVGEAGGYLDANVVGPLLRDRRLNDGILKGEGITVVPRAVSRALNEVASAVGLVES